MAELVDAHVSGACSERSAGSSPVPGTKEKRVKWLSSFYFPEAVLSMCRLPTYGRQFTVQVLFSLRCRFFSLPDEVWMVGQFNGL